MTFHSILILTSRWRFQKGDWLCSILIIMKTILHKVHIEFAYRNDYKEEIKYTIAQFT